MRPPKNFIDSKPTIRVFHDPSTTGSGRSHSVHGTISQDHARPRSKIDHSIMSPSTSDVSTSVSILSLTSSIHRFRTDFEDLQCKMRIFGESLNLCRCMADDFSNKLTYMEKRLHNLEKRQMLWRSESNYSAIIKKNQRLSHKTLNDAKKLQMCGTEDEMREVAARICRNYLHGAWKTVDPTALEFRRISGGLSNFLYYVALPDDCDKLNGYVARDSSPECDSDNIAARLSRPSLGRTMSFNIEEPRKVLLRIYGQVHGERAMDAIVTESVIFTLLSERRLGPKLHGVFSGGRIEEYIPARCLKTTELAEPSYSMKIAEKMAAIHSMDVPLNKEPNWLWKTMGKWSKTVREEKLSGSYQAKNDEERHIIKELKNVDFDKELEWLKKYLATIDSPVVFCHNDMQEGNILLLEDTMPVVTEDEMIAHSTDYVQYPHSNYDDANTSDSITSRISDIGEPRLVLIDFEYCAYNYRGFDIANHFQEWLFNYTHPEYPFYRELVENAPALDQKEIFIKEYLKHYQMNIAEEKPLNPPSIDDVNHLLTEVEAFTIASHLLWSLWSFVNASKSQIPFGYWEYGFRRLEIYLNLKQEAIKKDNYGIPQKRKICEVDI